MKLLIVTGIANSNWKACIEGMNIPLPSISSEAQSALENLHAKTSNKEIAKTLVNVLNSLDAKQPHLALLPNCVSQIDEILENEAIKSLVFYGDPEYSLAHELSTKLLSEEESLATAQIWKNELKTAFSAYRKHRKNCMLVNGKDVLTNLSQSQPIIAKFCETDVTVTQSDFSMSQDKLLAAKLALQDQDDLFDYYDEIRSDAPAFGPFSVSGVTQTSELSSLALSALEEHQSERKKLTQAAKESVDHLATMKNELQQFTENVAKLSEQKQQLQKHNSELSEKISGLEGQHSTLKTQFEQLSSESESKVLQLEKVQQDLTASRKELGDKTDKLQQLEQQLSEHKAQSVKVNDEQVAQLKKVQDELAASRKELGDKTGKLQQLEQQLSEHKAQSVKVNDEQVAQLKKVQDELAASRKELGDKTDKLQQLEQQLSEHKAQSVKVNDEQVAQLKKAQDELAASRKELGDKTDKLQQLEQQLSEHKAQSVKVNDEQVAQLKKVQDELAASRKELGDKTDKLQQLEQQLSEHKAQSVKVNDEQVAQLKKVQEELAASHKQQADKTQKLQQLEKQLSEQKTQSAQESELQLLQIAQLQEELEQTYNLLQVSNSETQKLEKQLSDQKSHYVTAEKELKQDVAKHIAQIEKLKQDLQGKENQNRSSSEQLSQIQTQLEQAISESELQVLQIAQLQEDLESSYTQLQTTNGKLQQLEKQLSDQKSHYVTAEKAFKADVAKHIAQIEKLKQELQGKENQDNGSTEKLSQVQTQLKQAISESELQVLQIAQLQEELEATYLQLQQSQSKLSQKRSEDEDANTAQQKVGDLQAENEIAMLQINQLQEELEYYYQQLQEKESAPMIYGQIENKPIQKVFDKSAVAHAEIVSGYSTNGYSDLQIRLEKVTLADGRFFESILCKLVKVEGRVGIEFRENEADLEFRWLDDLNDDYGHFITYIPNPPEGKAKQQQRVDEKLNASERVVVLSIASLLSDALQLDNLSVVKQMEEGELRDWRLSAIELKSQIAKLPVWMSFDQITLVEELRTDDYEHLWLRFTHLLVDEQLFPEFEVKFTVTGKPTDTLFTNEITLELRELPAGFGPLQAWPPMLKDDYGYKFQAKIALEQEPCVIYTEDKTSQRDKQLIRHLLKNLTNFIPVFTQQGSELTRDVEDWQKVARILTQVVDIKEQKEQSESQSSDLELGASDINSNEFQFSEFVDLGGYQHVVFEHEQQPQKTLKLKVRAEDINFESGEARLALELRTGDDSVLLADSSYFAEDDYGPRVLFAYDAVDELIFNDTLNPEQRALLSEFIKALPALIEEINDMNEQTQLNWSNWLSEK